MTSRDTLGRDTFDLSPDAATPAVVTATHPGPLTPPALSTQQRIEEKVRQRLLTAPLPVTRLGRFVVLEQVGQGGMGRVYTAYDEQLDRKIAIKVLHDDDLPTDAGRLRFLREGQALARLSHPNVVTVHEVGEHDGQIFLAMEYIPGQSLDAWLRTEPEWLLVLETFAQAGRGLLAAHLEGLVHRDFKPHNVMRTEDGLVKVLDFGLVRMANDALEASTEQVSLSGSNPALSSSLTHEGTVMGTPAYMAPEQFKGDEADAKSDQYCFCVALWEGLTGERPFRGKKLETLFKERVGGPPPWPDDAPPVPRTIVEALRRGLSFDQDERWPSMEALLTALDWDPRRHRERQRLGLVVVGMLAVSGTAAAMWSQGREPKCNGARQQLAGIWDSARQAEVEAAIVGVGPSYADEVWSKTRRDLTSYTDQWVSMHTEACEATTVRGEQSTRVLDLRMACLRRGAQDLRATVDTLADADADVVQRAHDLVADLPLLSRCDDTEALEAEVEPPRPEHAEAVEAARQHLARVKSLVHAGRHEPARSAVEAADEALRGVDYGPVQAELLYARGRVHRALEENELARQAFSEAVQVASRWGRRVLTTEAAISLMYIVGYQQARPTEALMLQPFVLGLTEDDPRRRADYRHTLSTVLMEQGKAEEAEAEIRAVLESRERTLGPDHPKVVYAHNTLGNTLRDQGKLAEAEAEFRRALESHERSLGPDHIDIGHMKGNLVSMLAQQDKLDQALQEGREALAILEKALGPDHLNLASSHNNLGNVLSSLGKDQDAESHFRTASRMWGEAFGHDSPRTLLARGNLANLLRRQGKLAEAEEELRAILSIGSETMPDDHRFITDTRWNLAGVLEARGQYEEALALMNELLVSQESQRPQERAETREKIADLHRSMGEHERAEQERRAALAIRLEAEEPDPPGVAMARLELAELLRDSDRPAEALPLAELAWDALRREETSPADRGRSALLLATLLWDADGSTRGRLRARTVARDILSSPDAADARLGPEIREAEAWLAEHPAP